MTGEVFDLLQGHSILSRLMTKGAVAADRWFLEGVLLGRQGGLLNRLFSARSRALTGDLPEAEVRSYLSGLLIGDELATARSEEHTSELQSLMRISYAVFCLKKKKINQTISIT